MGPFAALVLAFAAAHVQVADGSAQQCYVCEPRGGDTTGSIASLFKDQQPVLKCEDFKKEDSRFIKTCPAGYQGCLTQSVGSGHHVTRTCGDIKINDCRVANGVQYCYCSTALCNGQSHDPPPDDEPEDSVEGSASGEDATKHTQTPGTTPSPVAPPTTHSASSHVKSGAAPRTLPPLALLALALALLAAD